MNQVEHKQHEGMKRGVYLIPSLFTTANLFCGFFSIIKAMSGEFALAAWIIILAGVFDFLDGRVARFARAESNFGVEYDSLVDFASFGLAPAFLVYSWTLHDLGKFGWIAAFVYFACGALRLARFNVQHETIEKRYFEGLPIPSAAGFLCTYVIFYHNFSFFPPQFGSIFVGVMCIVLAFLMVSNIRYRSMKVNRVKSRRPFVIFIFILLSLFIIGTNPEIALFAMNVIYIF